MQDSVRYLCAKFHSLVPPSELLEVIFPWVEDELAAYERRLKDFGPKATDYALKNFLTLLAELRTVILQDGAVLFVQYPNLPLWSYPPFNAPKFSEFAHASTAVLAKIELIARQNLEALPETMAATMKGILSTISLQLDQDRSAIDQRFDRMENVIASSSNSSRSSSEQPTLAPIRKRSGDIHDL